MIAPLTPPPPPPIHSIPSISVLRIRSTYNNVIIIIDMLKKIQKSKAMNLMFQNIKVIINVSLRLRVHNAVPAQPCVGKIRISLVLLNFLHCNFRLWFETP